jgi:quercetin dioxygenase-like cupin family protein
MCRENIAMADNWYAGNAGVDAAAHRGWLLGHFVDPSTGGVRSTEAVEVKWGVHPAGQQRPEWTTDDRRTTMLVLIEGRFRIDLAVGSTLLSRQGDYVVWGPGIDHSWRAEEDSIVLTVRWPSRANR